MITIKGNTAINCGSLLNMETPHTANVQIEDNKGFGITGNLINLKVYVDPTKLNSFLAEVKPHMHELKGEQLESFERIIKDLADPTVPEKSGVLAQLADFGKSVASGVISTIIAAFIGGPK